MNAPVRMTPPIPAEGSTATELAGPQKRARVLCVDDEIEVLRAIARNLGRHYEVSTATSGASALKQLEQDAGVEVIISDMRMPGLSGAEFLSQSRALAPDAQRILLTGQTDLASAIAAINEGQIFRFLSKPCAMAELISTIEAALERHRSRTTQQAVVRREAEQRQMQVDALTGLASKLQFLRVLEAAALDSIECTDALIAYYVAIDNCDEPITARDTPWGDELATIIAERLKQQCRGATLIACWGIEQFVVLMSTRDTADEDLVAVGEEIHQALVAPITFESQPVAVSASIGIARLMDRPAWPKLVRQAATAAREARREEGGRVCLFRPDVPLAGEKQRELVRALRVALAQGSLHLHYQPIVDVQEGRVRALECLVRWEHPTLGNIGPDTFIPVAAQSDQIVRLGEWVLWQACHEGRQLVGSGRLEIAVNVSATQLADKNFLPHLEKCLSDSGLRPECLELELTESELAGDMEHLREVLEQVRQLRVRIAVDDFGTGYSSLSYLSRLPIDVLKVDRAFVRDFEQGGKTIIKAALTIARDFGQEVIIEGVETAEMLRQVRDLGAHLIQGYWFAKPMPADQIAGWLEAFDCGTRTRAKDSAPAVAAGRP